MKLPTGVLPFLHSSLGCSWLCQIGGKSLGSLYTSSERTVNKMWGRLGFLRVWMCACVCLSLWWFSFTLQALPFFFFFSLHCCSDGKWQKHLVFLLQETDYVHGTSKLVLMGILLWFSPDFVERECLTVVLGWGICLPSPGIHPWIAGSPGIPEPSPAPCMVFSK